MKSLEDQISSLSEHDSESIYDELSGVLADFVEASETRAVLADLSHGFSLEAVEENEIEQYKVSQALLDTLSTKWGDDGHKIRGTDSLNDTVSSVTTLITMISNKNEIRWSDW